MLKQISYDSERGVYEYNILDSNSQRVGMVQLRTKPSKSPDMPEGFESHIYYEVNAEHRGKGYATEALRELVKEARKHGLTELTATVNQDNPASIAVLEKCGARLIESGSTKGGQPVLKYHLKTDN